MTINKSSSSFWQRKTQTDLLRASDEYLRNLELQIQATSRNTKRSASGNNNYLSSSRTASGAK